jgi:hypothetical protein
LTFRSRAVRLKAQPGTSSLKRKSWVTTSRASLKAIAWPKGISVSSFHEMFLPNPRKEGIKDLEKISEYMRIPATPITNSAICKAPTSKK